MARWQYQQKVEVLSTEGENITLDKWFRPPSEPVRVSPNFNWITAGDFKFEPFTVTPPIDRWAQPIAQPVLDIRRQQQTYPFFFFDPFPIVSVEEITLDKWFVQASEPVRRVPEHRWVYPSFVIDPNILTQGERIYFDGWNQPIGQRMLQKSDRRWLYPFFFSDTQLFVVPPIAPVGSGDRRRKLVLNALWRRRYHFLER